jgi:lysozyme family protein
VSSSIVLETLFSDAVCTLYRGRSLIVLAWHSTPTVTVIGAMAMALMTAVRSDPANTLICALIDTRMPMPDSAAREALEVRIQRLGTVRGAVNVIAGTGFRAAAMRGLLSGLARVARPSYPVSYVGTPSEAAAFLALRWPPTDAHVPSQSELERVLTAVMPTYLERKTA